MNADSLRERDCGPVAKPFLVEFVRIAFEVKKDIAREGSGNVAKTALRLNRLQELVQQPASFPSRACSRACSRIRKRAVSPMPLSLGLAGKGRTARRATISTCTATRTLRWLRVMPATSER
jgi:hypothetical protein